MIPAAPHPARPEVGKAIPAVALLALKAARVAAVVADHLKSRETMVEAGRSVKMADETTTNVLESQILGALVYMLQSATTPEALQAQTIMMRRLALQSDITGSRVPAPANITEIGGYLNLLDTLQQPEIRAQTLTAILGVAGPNPPLGWLSTKPPLSMVALSNDRPEGAAQPAIPLTISVRVDFVAALQGTITTLHDQGCDLPLLSPTLVLPQAGPGVTPPEDVLAILGRVLWMVPGVALQDPATDPIVLARPRDSNDPFQRMVQVDRKGTWDMVPKNNWDTLKGDAVSCRANKS